MRVFFSNLGCKLNQAELEQLAREFRACGHTIASSLTEADLHVVNSCTVTHMAARDSRKLARRGRRLNPAIRTVLTGCYVTAVPEEASGLAGVDLIVSNDEKDRLVEHVHRAFPEPGRPLGVAGSLPIPFVPLEFGNSRALVKVEDGCNMRCSFCVIPFTRGRQRSRPMSEVVHEVGALGKGGFHEVVITGVQISSYRDGGSGLFALVETVLAKTAVARLRLTSIAPWQFDHRLLELFSTGRLCRHFHLSLQSGCARTLSRMHRPYSPQEYAELLSTIRERLPGVAITTDLIVGFPGESDRDFKDSLDFCNAPSRFRPAPEPRPLLSRSRYRIPSFASAWRGRSRWPTPPSAGIGDRIWKPAPKSCGRSERETAGTVLPTTTFEYTRIMTSTWPTVWDPHGSRQSPTTESAVCSAP
jgi:threonylcarbamoyladenosine tRNA methylthiotransferase MtaB